MRHGDRRALALAVATALCLGALLDAGESTNKSSSAWYTRMFRWNAPKKAEPKGDEPDTVIPAVTPAVLRQRAILEWSRRQEVVDKLREIAFQTGDDELRRKADQLNDRIWDTYMKATAGLPQGGVSPEERILENKLGIDAASRTPAQGASGRKSEQASRKE